jgi:hypothetical protein
MFIKKFANTRLAAALILFALSWQIMAGEDELAIEELVAQIESAENERQLRSAMRGLAQIGDAKSANVFVDTMERKILSSNIRLMPYLAYINEFNDEPAIRTTFSDILRNLESQDLDEFDRVYVAGSLAKFGDSSQISWLVDRYGDVSARPNGRSFAVLILKTLGKVNQTEASDFVVNRALESMDPALILSLEYVMRSAGNPRSIDIMRRWNSVESGDIDLIVVEHYLKAIIAFGDAQDKKFLVWLRKNGSDYFPFPEYEQYIVPWMNEASEKIDYSK